MLEPDSSHDPDSEPLAVPAAAAEIAPARTAADASTVQTSRFSRRPDSRSAPEAAGGAEVELDPGRLVRLAREGDAAAFEALVRRHEVMVLRTARALVGSRSDAEDVAQEAFLRFYRHLGKVDTGRDPAGWLYRLTVNCSWDLLGRRRRETLIRETVPAKIQPPPQLARDAAESSEVREILSRSLQILPPRARAVFVLCEIEGLEVARAARVLRITRITVRRHLSRARDSLRQHLQAIYPELM